MRPKQNDRHFVDNHFKSISLNQDQWIWIDISLKFVPKGQINNIPSSIGSDNGLVPTRQQGIIWTNDGKFTNACMRHSASMS